MNSQITFPIPNKYKKLEPVGRDFLGQQSIIQHLANQCLPSFTNATRRLRYYTFWSWAFKMAQKFQKELNEPKATWWYLLRLETFFILTNKYLNPGISDLTGVTRLPIDYKKLYSFRDNSSVKIYSDEDRISSYSPVRYSPSLDSLNIVHHKGNNYFLNTFGNRLAESFDSIISKYKDYVYLINPQTKSIKFKIIKNLSKAFSLEQISLSEKKIFKEIIEQNEYGTLFSAKITNRIYSTLLLLDIIKKCKVKSSSDCQHHIIIQPYNNHLLLNEIKTAFQLIELRRYFQYALETILASFCRFLIDFDNKESTFNKFFETSYLHINEFQKNGKGIFAKIVKEDQNFSEFYKCVMKFISSNDYNYDYFYREIRKLVNERKYSFEPNAVLYSLMLLSKIYAEFSKLVLPKTTLINDFINYPTDIYNYSFSSFRIFFEKLFTVKTSKAIKEIIIEMSLKLHLAVSQDKLRGTGNFTFRFLRSDTIGFKLLENISKPNMTNNKLYAYFELVEDMGLIAKNGKYYNVTKDGGTFYNKYLK